MGKIGRSEDKAVITVLRILNDGRDWMSIIK